MRRFSFMLAALLVAWNIDAVAQPRAAALPLATGQAISLSLDGAMRDVVIGDPDVADISIVNDRTLVVLGKRPGVTNLLIFGAGGRPLSDRQLIVSEAGDASVTVYRGTTTTNYACPRQCARLAPATGASPP